VALRGSKLDQEPYAAAHAISCGSRDLDLAIEHDQPRALMNLVVGEALASRQIEHDRAGGITRGENFRQPRLEIKRPEIPAIQRVSFGMPSLASSPG